MFTLTNGVIKTRKSKDNNDMILKFIDDDQMKMTYLPSDGNP